MIVVLVSLEVIGETVDALREERDLHLRRAGISCLCCVVLDNFLLALVRSATSECLSFQCRRRQDLPARSAWMRPQPGCRPAGSRATSRGAPRARAMAGFIHECAAIARENRCDKRLDSARLTDLAEIEHAGRPQLARVDLARRRSGALAGGIGRAHADRRVAAAHQHGWPRSRRAASFWLTLSSSRSSQRRLDGQQQARAPPRRPAVRRPAAAPRRLTSRASLERRRRACGAGAMTCPRQPSMPAHVAGERAHVGALAAVGLEDGGVGVRHVDQLEPIDVPPAAPPARPSRRCAPDRRRARRRP